MDDTLLPLWNKLCGPHRSFRRRDALGIGLDDRDLRRLVKAEVLARIRHGSYAPYDAWRDATPEQRHEWLLESVVRDARSPVAAAEVSALVMYGAPTWRIPLTDVHLLRLDGRAGRKEAGVTQHQGVVLPGDVVEVRGTPTTSPARTCLDVSRTAGLEATVVVMNWFLHEGLLDQATLAARAEQYALVPHTLTTDLAVRLADPRVESVGESRTLVMCWHQGLPRPEPQYVVRDAGGAEIARLDFAWPERKVWLEFDGRQKYVKWLEPGQDVTDVVLAERRRERFLRELLGWECIRIDWADLARPQATAAYIRSVLASGSHR